MKKTIFIPVLFILGMVAILILRLNKMDGATYKTCTKENNEDKTEQTLKFTAKNNKIYKFEVILKQKGTKFGIDDFSKVDEKRKEEFEEIMLKKYDYNDPGIKAEVKFKKDLIFSLNIDLEKAKKENVKDVSENLLKDEMLDLEKSLDSLRNSGYICN